jgi:hypothetical protein
MQTLVVDYIGLTGKLKLILNYRQQFLKNLHCNTTQGLMQNYTDDDLIKGCINGNAHIEYALYKTYASKLFAVALRYTHIEADAEDVLQNAFVDIYKNIGKFKYQGSFEGWLRKIVARTAINCFKKQAAFC